MQSCVVVTSFILRGFLQNVYVLHFTGRPFLIFVHAAFVVVWNDF